MVALTQFDVGKKWMGNKLWKSGRLNGFQIRVQKNDLHPNW